MWSNLLLLPSYLTLARPLTRRGSTHFPISIGLSSLALRPDLEAMQYFMSARLCLPVSLSHIRKQNCVQLRCVTGLQRAFLLMGVGGWPIGRVSTSPILDPKAGRAGGNHTCNGSPATYDMHTCVIKAASCQPASRFHRCKSPPMSPCRQWCNTMRRDPVRSPSCGSPARCPPGQRSCVLAALLFTLY